MNEVTISNAIKIIKYFLASYFLLEFEVLIDNKRILFSLTLEYFTW